MDLPPIKNAIAALEYMSHVLYSIKTDVTTFTR